MIDVAVVYVVEFNIPTVGRIEFAEIVVFSLSDRHVDRHFFGEGSEQSFESACKKHLHFVTSIHCLCVVG